MPILPGLPINCCGWALFGLVPDFGSGCSDGCWCTNLECGGFEADTTVPVETASVLEPIVLWAVVPATGSRSSGSSKFNDRTEE